MAGRDATEKLLADDDDLDGGLLGGDGTGPLAGMKRQLRLLSQQDAALPEIEEEPALLAEGEEALMGEAMEEEQPAPAAKVGEAPRCVARCVPCCA